MMISVQFEHIMRVNTSVAPAVIRSKVLQLEEALK
jgi:hypothetical protein